MSTISVDLTPQELVLLDGKCGDKVQSKVDEAKNSIAISAESGLSQREAAMVAKIVAAATARGRLTYGVEHVKFCPCCGRSDGYYLVQRTSRNKRKGDPDYNKPKRFRAYDLDRGFITVSNTIFVGYCDSCKDRVEPVLIEKLKGVRAQVPFDMPVKYRRYDNRKCTACGWTGHEGELGMLPAIMGGYYPGECPKCHEKNLPFGRTVIEHADGFTVVEVQEAQ